jgi:hypothetical protein
MTRPQAVTLGPFLGGLNTSADSKFMADDELMECINFEVDIDGSLMCRPAITETVNNESWGFERFIPIGRVNFTTGGDYLIVSSPQGTHAFDGTDFTFIYGGQSRCAVQYLDNVYIVSVPGEADNGGRWDGTTFTADASMPRGEAAFFHKSRMFVVPGRTATTNPSRLIFTNVITSTTLSWPAANNIDIQPGDGDNLVDATVYNDNIVLFKENSIYLLAYDIRPTDAVLRQVITGIGVNYPHCVDTHENSVFFLHEGKVWEMSNYEFTHINQKVPFELDQTLPQSEDNSENAGAFLDPVWLRKMGDRLLVGFHNKRYAYNLLTRTWGEWQMQDNNAQSFGPPMEIIKSVNTNEPVRYYCAPVFVEWGNFYYFTDKYVPGTRDASGQGDLGFVEYTYYNIMCSMRTKEFTFDIPLLWKRLMWWGVNALTGTTISAEARPNRGLDDNDLWEDVALYDWDDLDGTWENMLGELIVSDVQTGVTGYAGSKFYKFLKSLRFRSISFKVTIENDGTTPDGPCRVMDMTAIVGLKQVVGKDMNA